MSSPFVSTGQKNWINFHRNLKTTIADRLTVGTEAGTTVLQQYNAMTSDLQGLVRRCLADNRSLRAIGAGWSWTGVVTATDGIILDTSSQDNKGMDLVMDLDEPSVDRAVFTEDPALLVLCQCGIQVRKLNAYLEKTKRSLKTSGASDGQTIVGAMTTGTHGSNPLVGAIADCVAGIHLVTGPDPADHIWVQRASHRIVSSSFLASLNNPRLINDDDVFNSALVSLGSYGIIHGILIETEPLYHMRLIRKTFPFDAKLLRFMNDLDGTAFGLAPYNGEPLNHIQVVLDPYSFDIQQQTGQAIVTFGYKVPALSSFGVRMSKLRNFLRRLTRGVPNDIVRVLSGIDLIDKKAIPEIVEAVLKASYKSENQLGTLGELFTGEGPPSKLAGSTMSVDIRDVPQVLGLFQRSTPSSNPAFAGIFSLRFVKSSSVTMACNRFGPVSCAVEADGILNARTESFYKNVWDGLRALNIPFRFHLGKLNDLDQAKMQYSYGTDISKWRQARAQVLSNPAVTQTFMNNTLRDWGLG